MIIGPNNSEFKNYSHVQGIRSLNDIKCEEVNNNLNAHNRNLVRQCEERIYSASHTPLQNTSISKTSFTDITKDIRSAINEKSSRHLSSSIERLSNSNRRRDNLINKHTTHRSYHPKPKGLFFREKVLLALCDIKGPISIKSVGKIMEKKFGKIPHNQTKIRETLHRYQNLNVITLSKRDRIKLKKLA
ncbi:uncharacterized protein LOC135928945 [Gordionus sp. m RMFG-2023]|uniref:uncharacterized protein LOC135928945 n=1 Tax=Gordionus sp. m RMFG-2023 TaxID=3053472 RepID=UPI0031FD439D